MKKLRMCALLSCALILFSCQKSKKGSGASSSRTALEFNVQLSGVIYSSATKTGLSLVRSSSPEAGVVVKVYRLETDTLNPELIGTTTTNGEGKYFQYFTSTDASIFLVIASKDDIDLGQTIVTIPAEGQSLALSDGETRIIAADITYATTVASSLILGREVNLAELNNATLADIFQSVQTKIDSMSEDDAATMAKNLSSSSAFIDDLAKILNDDGITSSRSDASIDSLSTLIPSLPSVATNPSLTKIEIKVTKTSVPIGSALTLKAEGTYSDATKKDITAQVTWASSNIAVATVKKTPSAAMTGVAVGTVNISATLSGITATTALSVTAAELVSIDITPHNVSMARTSYQQFTATGLYTDNSTQDLTSAATWTSADTARATVNDSSPNKGVVTSISAGSASITATVGSISGLGSFTVTSATLSSIQVTPASQSVAAGLTLSMSATGVYSDATTQDLTAFATWSSDDTAVATVSNSSGTVGRVTAVALGTANISATLNSVVGSESVQVTAAEITDVQLTPASASIAKGTSVDITATGIFTDASNSDITDLATWSSSATGVATVTTGASPRGRITAVGVGTSTITATYNGESMTLVVTVTAATLVSIAVTPANPSTPLGETNQFTATGTYTDATTQDLSSVVTWSSSDTTNATISNASGSKGLATTIDPGTSTISAAYNSLTGSTTFTVSPASLVSIAVTSSASTVAKGLTQQFTATGTYTDASILDITSSVTWSSSSVPTASISNAGGSEGLATAADVGTTTITATSNAISGDATFNVTAATLVSIAVTPANPSVAKGSSEQFTATGHFTDSSTLDLTTQVTWQSSSTSVATISNVNASEGLAQAATIGSSTISAAYNSLTGQTTMIVGAPELVSIAVTPGTPSIAKGLTQQFTATGTYTDGTTQDLSSTTSWFSDTTATATIASTGLATAVAIGSTNISATTGSISGSAELTVTAATLVSIAVTPANGSVYYAKTQQFTATGTLTDGSTSNLTASATWSTSNAGVASINASTGVVTGAGVGSATITATIGAVSNNTGLTVEAQVAPTNTTISSTVATSSSEITLTWAAGTGSVESYQVAYQTGGTPPANCSSGTVITGITTTSKLITGLAQNTRYDFRVCTLNGNATPDMSSGVTSYQTTQQSLPSNPTNITGYWWAPTTFIRINFTTVGTPHHFVLAWMDSQIPSSCSQGNVRNPYVSGDWIIVDRNLAFYGVRVCAVDAAGNVSSGITINQYVGSPY